MQKAIPIAQDAIVNLVNSGSHIPKWILTDFKANGYFNDSSGVRVVTDTQDPEQLKTDVTSLPIGGGGQEEVLLAIQRTLGVMPDNGVILVFTDEPTTQLDLESAVTAEATRKNVKVFFALLGDPGQESEQVYERVSEGRVFRANTTSGTLDFDSQSFFDAIIYQVQHTSCVVGTTPPAGTTDPGTTPGTTPPAVTTDPGNTSPGQCTSTQLAQKGTVAFAVDTTASMQKAIPIAQDAIVNLVNSGSHIPKWILTDFKANGYFNDSSGVRVVTDTQDPEQLKTDVTSLPIGGGGQEEVLLAIQRTLGVMPDNGVILVFTDEPTTQLDLESAVTAEATRKNVKVFFALLGDPGQESEQVYERVSEGRVFRANTSAGTLDFDSQSFFDAIIYQVQHTNCAGANSTTLPPSQCIDDGCSSEHNGLGVCVDFSKDVDWGQLAIEIDFSAGQVTGKCGNARAADEECCKCMKMLTDMGSSGSASGTACSVNEGEYIAAGNNTPGGASLKSNGPLDCAQKCLNDSGCKAWTLNVKSNKC